MTDQPAHKPGFYDDPNDDTVQRYWDGSRWTDSRQAKPVAPTEEKGGGLAVAGYVTAIIVPIVGFIIGIILIAKSNKSGLPVILTSIAAFVIWLLIIGAAAEESYNTGGRYNY